MTADKAPHRGELEPRAGLDVCNDGKADFDTFTQTGKAGVTSAHVVPGDCVHVYEQDGTRDNSAKWWTSNFDDYDMFMNAGSAGELGKQRGLEQTGFWRKVIEHPSYDAFWQNQAVDKLLAATRAGVADLQVALEQRALSASRAAMAEAARKRAPNVATRPTRVLDFQHD